MKRKIFKLITILVIMCSAVTKAFATGGFSVSTTSISLYPGDTATFSISSTNAAGRLDLSVANSAVATIGVASVFLDNSSENIVVTAQNVGSTTINIVASSDFATYDEEFLSGQTYRITVNVNARPKTEVAEPTPTPTPTPTPQSNYQTVTTENVAETEPDTANNESDTEDENSQDDDTEPVAASTLYNSAKGAVESSANKNTTETTIDYEMRAFIFMLISLLEGIALLTILGIFLIKKIRKNRQYNMKNIEIKPL